jgi:hypothetical protein
MPKTKVVELFKHYNIVLGLKLKNSKLAALHVGFLTKVKFKLPWFFQKGFGQKFGPIYKFS